MVYHFICGPETKETSEIIEFLGLNAILPQGFWWEIKCNLNVKFAFLRQCLSVVYVKVCVADNFPWKTLWWEYR